MEEWKGRKRDDERTGREEESVVDCLNHGFSRIKGFHGLKLLDGRDLEIAPTNGIKWVAAYGVCLLL